MNVEEKSFGPNASHQTKTEHQKKTLDVQNIQNLKTFPLDKEESTTDCENCGVVFYERHLNKKGYCISCRTLNEEFEDKEEKTAKKELKERRKEILYNYLSAKDKKPDKGKGRELITNIIIKNEQFKTIPHENNKNVLIKYSDGTWDKYASENYVKELISFVLSSHANKHEYSETIEKIKVLCGTIKENELNKAPYFAFRNKTLDLEHLEFVEHSPNYLLTRKMDLEIPNEFNFESNINSEWEKSVWYKFLNEIYENDQQKINTILEAIGDMFEPHYKSQALFLHIGEGWNGKGTLLNSINNFIGSENCSNLSLRNISDNFLLENLFTALANICGDNSNLPLYDTGIIKKMRGKDWISADRKFLPILNFQNKAKGHWAMQTVPQSPNDKSEGFYRSFITIQYYANFELNNDPDLEDKLSTDKEKLVLLKQVLIALKRLRKKDWKFSYNPSVETRKEAFIIGGNSNDAFVELKTMYLPDNEIMVDLVQTAFIDWCKKNNKQTTTPAELGKALRRKYKENIKRIRHRIDNKFVSYYKNISFVEDNGTSVTGVPSIPILQTLLEKNNSSIGYKKEMPSTPSTPSPTISKIIDLLYILSRQNEDNDIHITDLKLSENLNELNITEQELDKYLESLSNEGRIYEPRPGVFRLSDS